mmetsp:Transcript_59540/g.66624  ORF Transcript_59540/g.66624 Transcript_59540/m.66624 type:complete len:85 (-) Transcript_59540:70-324(-)
MVQHQEHQQYQKHQQQRKISLTPLDVSDSTNSTATSRRTSSSSARGKICQIKAKTVLDSTLPSETWVSGLVGPLATSKDMLGLV